MGNTSHRLPSGGAVRRGLPPSGDRWLRETRRIVAIGCQAVEAVRGGLPPSGDRWLRATGGEGYATEYPRQDSNRSKKAQGKQHVSKIVPPPVPPLSSSMPLELVELWPTLTDAQQAELLRVARAMADHPVALDG
jgi:hypothetical protein